MTQLPVLHKHSLGKIESLTVVLKERGLTTWVGIFSLPDIGCVG